MPKGIRPWADFHVLVVSPLFKIYQMFKPADTNRNTLGRRVSGGGGSSTPCPMRLTSSHTHTPSPLTLPGARPTVNCIPVGREALTESCCFFSCCKCQPLAGPDLILLQDTQPGPTASDPPIRGAAIITCPGLKPGSQSRGVHRTAATQPALQASVQARTGPSIWGSLFAAFLVPALKPSSQQPPPAHRPAGKLLPSCGWGVIAS